MAGKDANKARMLRPKTVITRPSCRECWVWKAVVISISAVSSILLTVAPEGMKHEAMEKNVDSSE
jgi:hypothetical protein